MPNTPTSAAMAPTVVANRDTLNYSTTSLETEPDRLQAEVGQAEEGSQIRTTEGSVEHIEALGMDGVGTSIIEGLDPCLQPHHPPFTGMSPLSKGVWVGPSLFQDSAPTRSHTGDFDGLCKGGIHPTASIIACQRRSDTNVRGSSGRPRSLGS